MDDYSKKYLLSKMNLQKTKLLEQQKLLNKLNEKLNEERKKFMDSEMKITMLNRPKLKFKNCNLKKIINVYQPKYRNHTCQGFGDFLRGSFFLVQFCLYNKIHFDMNYNNHSISKYIKNSTPLKYDIKHDEVDSCKLLENSESATNPRSSRVLRAATSFTISDILNVL